MAFVAQEVAVKYHVCQACRTQYMPDILEVLGGCIVCPTLQRKVAAQAAAKAKADQEFAAKAKEAMQTEADRKS